MRLGGRQECRNMGECLGILENEWECQGIFRNDNVEIIFPKKGKGMEGRKVGMQVMLERYA